MKTLRNWLIITFLVSILACFTRDRGPAPLKPVYTWKEMLPAGSGSHQYEWKQGTFPMGLVPHVAFGGNLWMIGQKASWSSADGISWTRHAKNDWGERIYLTGVYFAGKLWLTGGMRYQERELTNEIWNSKDGSEWKKAVNAEWEPRKGQALVVFKNKMWLFGGTTRIARDFESLEMKNDVWSSPDGLKWTREVAKAPWSPRDSPQMVVMRDTLYMVGAQGMADVWRSADGKNWTQLTAEAGWKKRYDAGVHVYDSRLWLFGGRDLNTDHHKGALNDIWFSANGTDWYRYAEHAPWSVRSGGNSVVFHDQMWIFSGKHTGANPVWKGDVWALQRR
ncbi:hypothetical protein GCM10007423_50360 [Dyadobacter endophyticus]|uniref:DUF6242 domain-containing protein n=1 Tax=Dyadobacter endophyticus TaxID=1749036 RepID=A0ABQ1Z6M7_9BACT|nr:hypothetical protein [Dyadobacter endophyticus]GGH48854.1 hypothetical protein GCM10007423_50360 [Dyadobacter endophyticus]